MNEDFIRERITQLRLRKGISEYQMSYDLGHISVPSIRFYQYSVQQTENFRHIIADSVQSDFRTPIVATIIIIQAGEHTNTASPIASMYGLPTDEKTDFGKARFSYIRKGKISPHFSKKLTEKLTKSRFDATRSSDGYEKRTYP